jgi:hypothetical protein
VFYVLVSKRQLIAKMLYAGQVITLEEKMGEWDFLRISKFIYKIDESLYDMIA